MVRSRSDGISQAQDEQRLANIEGELRLIRNILRRGIPYQEDLVYLEWASSRVAVGETQDFDKAFLDMEGREVSFLTLSVVQIDIIASQLAVTDSVTLRLYTRGAKKIPQDLLADFNGASQLSDVWYASFSNRRIELRDLDMKNLVHGRISNTAGNSLPTPFIVRIYGRKPL